MVVFSDPVRLDVNELGLAVSSDDAFALELAGTGMMTGASTGAGWESLGGSSPAPLGSGGVSFPSRFGEGSTGVTGSASATEFVAETELTIAGLTLSDSSTTPTFAKTSLEATSTSPK